MDIITKTQNRRFKASLFLKDRFIDRNKKSPFAGDFERSKGNPQTALVFLYHPEEDSLRNRVLID